MNRTASATSYQLPRLLLILTLLTLVISGCGGDSKSAEQSDYTVSSNGNGNGGTISPTSQSIKQGESASFTITPSQGYSATATGCSGSLIGATYTTAAVSSNCSVSVIFSKNSYDVSTTASEGGIITPANQNIDYAELAQFAVTAETGYYTASVSGCNGSLVGTTYTTAAVDADCNINAVFSKNIIDVTAPTPPTVNDLTTEDTTPTISGSFDASDAAGGFTVTVNSVTYPLSGSDLSNNANNWSLTIPAANALAIGSYQVVATATDGSGNAASDSTSGDSTRNALTINDLTAPTPPTVNDLTTEDTTPTISGSFDASDVAGGFTVTVNNVAYQLSGSNLSNNADDWSLTIPAANALAIGSYQVVATATDGSGNAASDTTSNELTINEDVTAPASPIVSSLTTDDTTPTISGSFDASDAAGGFTVTVNNVTYPLSGTSLSNNADDWSLTIPAANALAIGSYQVVATATDGSGNAATDTTSDELNIQESVSHTPLNDTGIIWGGNYSDGNNDTCIGETVNEQDCSSGRDVTANNDADGHAGFSYSKIDANGNDLAAGEDNWSCVKDNVTGLIWEVKQGGNGILRDEGLHDADDRYAWNYAKTSYVASVNAATLCGASDWRLPNIRELSGLVNYNRVNPAIDTVWFPNTKSSNFWSSSLFPGVSYNAWAAAFNVGSTHSESSVGATLYVRLVRGAGQ